MRWALAPVPRVLGASLAAAALYAAAFGEERPASAAEGCPGAQSVPSASSPGEASRAIFCLVNEQRRADGIAPLQHNRALKVAATRHSRDMARANYFGHAGSTGASLLQRVRQAGFCGSECYVAENIAWGTGTLGSPAAIVQAWMNSPPHRAAILDGGLRVAGVGVAVAGAKVLVTEDFGS